MIFYIGAIFAHICLPFYQNVMAAQSLPYMINAKAAKTMQLQLHAIMNLGCAIFAHKDNKNYIAALGMLS